MVFLGDLLEKEVIDCGHPVTKQIAIRNESHVGKRWRTGLGEDAMFCELCWSVKVIHRKPRVLMRERVRNLLYRWADRLGEED